MEDDKGKEVNRSLIKWARVDAVINHILDNPAYLQAKRHGDLTRSVIEKIKELADDEICERTAERYIKEAKIEIRKLSKLKLKNKLEQAIIYRMSLVQRARKAKELKTELLTLKDIAELEGLYPEKNMKHSGEITVKNIDYSKLTKRQLQRLAAGEDINNIIADSNDDRSTN